MILSDHKIEELLESGDLVVDPIEASQVEPASVDLRLGDTFLVPKASSGVLSMSPIWSLRPYLSETLGPTNHLAVQNSQAAPRPS